MSLPFFPHLYPDELLYSILARYHVLSQNVSLKETVNDLFNRHSASAVIDLPSNLYTLCENLTPGSSITPEYLIEHHTLLPLYRPFLGPERHEKVLTAMKFGGEVHTTIGVMASSIKAHRRLRFCPSCVKNDHERYGEPYWHRTHQVPGVEVCHIHHQHLIDSNVVTTSKQNKHAFVAIEIDIIADIPLEPNQPASRHAIEIAQAVHWLLNNETPILNLKELQGRYVSVLKKMNLATVHFVRQRDFIESFRQYYYGSDLLKTFNCSVDFNQQNNWLSKMVRNPRTVAHPLQHVLLMKYLELTPESFLSDPNKYHPFGNGPWLCLNPVAEHYQKSVINQCRVTRDYKTGVPVGTFECSCGFVYSRRGPDLSESDQNKIGRIKKFGHVWEKELTRLVKIEKLSYNAAARSLRCDPTTAKKQFMKLQSKDSLYDVVMVNDDFDDECMVRRSKWLEAVASNKGMHKTAIRKMFKADYTWLYRHDRDWLHQNSPELLPRKKYLDNRVNWSERDDEICKKAEEVILKELKCAVKPTRLTVSFIGKQIGELSLLQKHMHRLPKTKAFIEKHQETVEEFQIRRVKYIAQKLCDQQDIVMEWQIVREAGLRPGYSQRVRNQILNVIGTTVGVFIKVNKKTNTP